MSTLLHVGCFTFSKCLNFLSFCAIAAIIGPCFDASQVQLAGDGLSYAKANHPASFLIDCNNAGEASIAVQINYEDGQPLQADRIQVVDNGNNTFT